MATPPIARQFYHSAGLSTIPNLREERSVVKNQLQQFGQAAILEVISSYHALPSLLPERLLTFGMLQRVNHLGRQGQEIAAGTLILSGGITEAVAVQAGDHITLHVQGMGCTSLRFV